MKNRKRKKARSRFSPVSTKRLRNEFFILKSYGCIVSVPRAPVSIHHFCDAIHPSMTVSSFVHFRSIPEAKKDRFALLYDFILNFNGFLFDDNNNDAIMIKSNA